MSDSEHLNSDEEVGGESENAPTPPLQTTSIFDYPSPLLKPFAKGPFNKQKPLLNLVTNLDAGKKGVGGGKNYRCNVCSVKFHGTYTRVRAHLTDTPGHGVRGCGQLSRQQFAESIRLDQDSKLRTIGIPASSTSQRHASSSSSPIVSTHSSHPATSSSPSPHLPPRKRGTVHDMLNVQVKEEADDAVAVFFYAHGLPFHISRSPYYRDAFAKVTRAGPSYVLPGETKLRTSLLEKQFSRCSLMKEEMRVTWMQNECSIIMDGWTDIRSRPLINIIVHCLSGPYFLRAIDCSGKIKDAQYQFCIMKEAIDEIGPQNVVQVVTDAAPVCKRAGKLIQGAYRHIFWTPCCVHALNNALKDIGQIEWVKQIVSEARELQMFICNHHTSLAIFRSFSKKEFLKPSDTRYATYFILLERMIECQEALQSMVICSEFKKWPESQSEQGKRVRDRVLDEDWWTQSKFIVSFIAPIVAVIRYCDSDTPTLGEIYETFDSMLEKMKEILYSKDRALYDSHIRPIIQKRWNKMNTPLHMAAYALNPKYYAPRPGKCAPNLDSEVNDGFQDCVAQMFSAEEASQMRAEFTRFTKLRGPRFSKLACSHDRATLAQSDPIGWWELYGDDAPLLKNLAIRLLSQVGSSSAAERNWSTYGFIHTFKRNRLTSRRAEQLVAVHSSLRLRDRVRPEYQESPTVQWDINVEEARQLEDDDEISDPFVVPVDRDAEGNSAHTSDDEDDDEDEGLDTTDLGMEIEGNADI